MSGSPDTPTTGDPGFDAVLADIFDPTRLARLTRDFASPATSGPAAPSAQAAILSITFYIAEKVYTMSLDFTKMQADLAALQATVSDFVSTHQQLKAQLSGTTGSTETDQQKIDDAVALLEATIAKVEAAKAETTTSAGAGTGTGMFPHHGGSPASANPPATSAGSAGTSATSATSAGSSGAAAGTSPTVSGGGTATVMPQPTSAPTSGTTSAGTTSSGS